MAGITLAQAEEQLDAYLTAETKVLGSQRYELAGRMLTRADIKEIRDGIQYWDAQVKNLSIKAAGRSRSRTIVAGG